MSIHLPSLPWRGMRGPHPSGARRPGERRPGGFTLVELVIVLLIIAILSSLGIYTYRWMLTKARMTQAKTALHHLVKTETVYFGENDRYTANLSLIDFNPVVYDYYQISVVLDNTAKNFTGIATGIGSMTGDRWYVTKDLAPYQDNTSPFFR
jgi:type IV pilus assembly protein PilE